MLYPNGSKTQPKVTSGYGPRAGSSQGGFHYGTDFVGFSNVVAIHSGTVTMAQHLNDNAGLTVAVDHGDGITSVYMHLANIAVRRGQKVAEGAFLGKMGDTGNASGLCCHLEIRNWSSGKCVWSDPVKWLPPRVNPPKTVASALKATQRKAATLVNRRRSPDTKHAALPGPLKKGVVGNFVGWKRGQKVGGNDVWFKGISGNWFWSGGFVGGAKTKGLKRL